MSAVPRPITMAILAMGGEGGGVLSNWVVALAETAGWHAQNTSVAGVAQRTGATIYYVELFPPVAGVDAEPVLSTMPTPGEVDVVVASELMEAGRAIQRGFVTPDRTTLICSTNRVYTITERSALGDGRVDDATILDSATVASKVLVAADFMKVANEASSVISAALFRAIAASGVLPFEREAYEAIIASGGKHADRSLAAFGAGADLTENALKPPAPEPVMLSFSTQRPQTAEELEEADRKLLVKRGVEDPESMLGPRLTAFVEPIQDTLPEEARYMALLGCQRTAVYQDRRYADLYMARIGRLAAFDGPDTNGRLSVEVARHVALWMCFQDTIQVAHQKVRRARLNRVTTNGEDGHVAQVREYLHPQIEELTDTMPTALGRRLRSSKWFARLVDRVTRKGIVLNTTSILGYTVLSTLARMRPLRRRSLRFSVEQARIDEWLALVEAQAVNDYELACETVECAGVLKGYGATHAEGSDRFVRLMDASTRLAGNADAAATLARLRLAALQDEGGPLLATELDRLGIN